MDAHLQCLSATAPAQCFSLLYGSFALLSFAATLLLVPNQTFLLPLLLDTPFALVALSYDVRQPRAWQTELSASVALTAVHILALLIITIWVSQGHLPIATSLIFIFFLLRAAYMLSPWANLQPARTIGIAEIVFGIILVLFLKT